MTPQSITYKLPSNDDSSLSVRYYPDTDYLTLIQQLKGEPRQTTIHINRKQTLALAAWLEALESAQLAGANAEDKNIRAVALLEEAGKLPD